MAEAGRDQSGFIEDHLVQEEQFSVRPHGADQARPPRSRGRRRMVFFALAAAWGFFSGTSAVLVVLTLLGRPLYWAPPLELGLAVAAVASLGGGLALAAAYRRKPRQFK